MPFLTLEDPNAKILGSRDPLGHVPIWDKFARRFIGNLTTASDSVRGFTTLMLGHYLAERYFEEGRIASIQEEVLPIVLRLEQLSAYAQYLANQSYGIEDGIASIRGITRVKEALKEKVVTIDTNRDGYILSDQKVYGLWGLYSVASRTSLLINHDGPGVTEQARGFIEQEYGPSLTKIWQPLATLLLNGGKLNVRPKPAPVLATMMKIMGPEFTDTERYFYNKHLCLCGGDHQEQKALSFLIEKNLVAYKEPGKSFSLSRGFVSDLQVQSQVQSDYLAETIEDVLVLEPLLLASERLFSLLCQSSSRSLADVAKEVGKELGDKLDLLATKPFGRLLPLIERAYPDSQEYPIAGTMERVHAALTAGDYMAALSGVLDWNAYVMKLRSSEPWVKIAENGAIDVRYRSNEQSISVLQDFNDIWKNSYFIASLAGVQLQLSREVQRVD